MRVVDFVGPGSIGGQRLNEAGVDGAVRYLGGWGRLRADERDDLRGHGIAVGLVWEQNIGDTLQGAALGEPHARTAVAEARNVGYPPGFVIFAACDTDPRRNRAATIDYYRAWSPIVRAAGYLSGAYLGDDPGVQLLDDGVLDKLWQPNATSWSVTWPNPRAHLVQNLEQPYDLGGGYDDNDVQGPVGLWGEGEPATPGTGNPGTRFSYPFAGSFPVTSPFGWRRSGFHTGVDLGCPNGTAILAAAAGVVVYAAHEEAAGNTVTLRHEGTVETRYHHLESWLVGVGEHVAAGQQIGWSDSTGRVDGPHLHFEIRTDPDTPVDPLPYLAGGLGLPPNLAYIIAAIRRNRTMYIGVNKTEGWFVVEDGRISSRFTGPSSGPFGVPDELAGEAWKLVPAKQVSDGDVASMKLRG